MISIWLSFFVSIILLLTVSRRNLGVALIMAGTILGLFTLPYSAVVKEIFFTVTDPSVLLLSLAISLIPLIGGILQESGMLDDLVHNLRIGRKPFLMFSPALVGLLPMPGGALLSAPLVERAGKNIKGEVKASLNIWFRHILFLIYPLSPTLIISARIAGLQVYDVIPYLAPLFLFSVVVGYLFFLRDVDGDMKYNGDFSMKKLSLPLAVILLAPFMDFFLQWIFSFDVREFFTLMAVSSSFLLALTVSRFGKIKKVVKEMKPWNFLLITLGMFIFLRIFEASGAGYVIASLPLSKILLGIGIGFGLALITGRVEVPASIILPIFLSSLSPNPLPPLTFALVFFAMFLGYMGSPVHPCVALSMEYFKLKLSDFFRVMALPTAITFSLAVVLAFIFGL